MSEKFYFVFSEGSDNFHGIYIGTREITGDEWLSHLDAYSEEYVKKRIECKEPISSHWASEEYIKWSYSKEANELELWMESNCPHRTFIDKHGLVELPYTEFWREEE